MGGRGRPERAVDKRSPQRSDRAESAKSDGACGATGGNYDERPGGTETHKNGAAQRRPHLNLVPYRGRRISSASDLDV